MSRIVIPVDVSNQLVTDAEIYDDFSELVICTFPYGDKFAILTELADLDEDDENGPHRRTEYCDEYGRIVLPPEGELKTKVIERAGILAYSAWLQKTHEILEMVE